MINFNNMEIMDHEETIFLPADLLNTFYSLLELKRPDVNFKLVRAFRFTHDSQAREQRQKYFESHSYIFKGTPYEDYKPSEYTGFTSRISPDWIYKNLKYFYFGGQEEDEEVKDWRKAGSKPALVEESADGSDVAVVNIDAAKFKNIGSYNSLKAVEELMKTKNLTEDDIMTVISAVQLK